jgi:dihydroxy-acid dehydratase
LAFVEDGDTITIDVANRRVDADVSDVDLSERRARWQPPPPRYTSGVFGRYAALVSSAAEGAILSPGL